MTLSSAAVLLLVLGGSLGEWDQVIAIAKGRLVEIQDVNKRKLKGPIVSASADSIVVRTKTGEQSVARDAVRRVKLRTAVARGRNTAIGAVVGAGVLIGAMAIAAAASTNDDLDTGELLKISAGAGAMWGAIAGVLVPGYSTVYQSP